MKILKNTTSSDIELFNIGLTVPALGSITLDTSDYHGIARADSILEITPLINNGNIVVNDGIEDLSSIDGINFIKFPEFAGSIRFLSVPQRSNGMTSKNTQEAIEEVKNTSQPLDPTLTSLANFNSNGILTQTAPDTFASRAITASSPISVSNGNAVAANPNITHNSSGVTANNYGSETHIPAYTVNATGHITSASNILIKPIALNFYQTVMTNSITTTSGTFSSMALAITPVAGTYIAFLNCDLTHNTSGTNNAAEITITIDGTPITSSNRTIGIAMSGISLASVAVKNSGSTMAMVTVNGSQNVVAHWRRADGSTTHTCTDRSLILVRVS